MTISWFSLIILCIFATAATIEIYRGVTRGFFSTLINLGLLVFSILASLFFAPPMARGIISFVFNRVVNPIPAYQDLVQQFQAIAPFIEAMAQMVASVLLFVFCFLLLRPLSRLGLMIFTKGALTPDQKDPGFFRTKFSFLHRHSKLLGGITGGICAVIISMVITSPIMGSLHVAQRVLNLANQFTPDFLYNSTTLSKKDVDMILACPDDLPGNVLYELGGEYMFNAAAKTNIYGNTVYLSNELTNAENTLHYFLLTYDVLQNPTEATVQEIRHLKDLRDSVTQLELCHGVMGEYFSYCAQAWSNDVSYYSFSNPEVHQVVTPVLDEVLTICAQSDAYTVKDNITTLLNMHILILESGIASIDSNDYLSLLQCLNDTHLITNLDAELSRNPNASHVRISTLGMQMMADMMYTNHYTPAQYQDFAETMANAMNSVNKRGYGSTEEKVIVLGTYVKRYFSKLGTTLPSVISEAVAAELVYYTENHWGEISSEQVQDFLKQYQ